MFMDKPLRLRSTRRETDVGIANTNPFPKKYIYFRPQQFNTMLDTVENKSNPFWHRFTQIQSKRIHIQRKPSDVNYSWLLATHRLSVPAALARTGFRFQQNNRMNCGFSLNRLCDLYARCDSASECTSTACRTVAVVPTPAECGCEPVGNRRMHTHSHTLAAPEPQTHYGNGGGVVRTHTRERTRARARACVRV